MSATITAAHLASNPDAVIEELYRAYRRIAALEETAEALLAWTHMDLVRLHSEDYGVSYMVRAHYDPSAVASHEAAEAASEAGAPVRHEARRVMCVDGVYYTETHYLTAEDAAAVRKHYAAQGHTVSAHHIRSKDR